MDIPQYIYDRYRQRYSVEVVEDSELSFYIKLKDGGRYIGQMLVSFLGDGMMILEDLYILSDQESPQKWSPGRKAGKMSAESPVMILAAKRPQGRRRPEGALNYRNKGLGSALIELVFELAEDRKGKSIYGSLIKEDIAITPHLLKWYLKRGFIETGPFKDCLPEARHYVRFDVPAQPH